jgi:hypothetical protein
MNYLLKIIKWAFLIIGAITTISICIGIGYYYKHIKIKDNKPAISLQKKDKEKEQDKVSLSQEKKGVDAKRKDTKISIKLSPQIEKAMRQTFKEFYHAALQGKHDEASKYLSSKGAPDIKAYCNYITMNRSIDAFTINLPKKIYKNSNYSYILALLYTDRKMAKSTPFDLETVVMEGDGTIRGIAIANPGGTATYNYENQYFHPISKGIYVMPFFLINEKGMWKIEARGIPSEEKK